MWQTPAIYTMSENTAHKISNDLLTKMMSHRRCFNPAIDVPSEWMSNEMSEWLATISLLVLSSNYHQNVNHQSVLCIIDCSQCCHWLYASLCWVLKLSPLTFTSCYVGLSSGHTHTNTCTNMLRVTHITVCKVYWKHVWLTEQSL